jgi:hypothetical protein
MNRNHPSLFDTAFRDGQQTQGVQLLVAKRLAIITALLPATQATRANEGSVNNGLNAQYNPLKSLMSNSVPRWDTP